MKLGFEDSLFGIRVLVNPILDPEPKISISKSCPVSDAFRSEFDEWLEKRFGTTGEPVVLSSPQGIIVGPKTLARMKARIDQKKVASQ